MLKMLLLILISLAPKFTLQGRVQLSYDKFNTITGVPAAATTYTTTSAVSTSPSFASSWQPSATFVSHQQKQQMTGWAPTAMTNDWYILQAAANAAAVAEAAATEVEATYSANQQHQKQQQQHHRHKAIAPLNNYEATQMAVMEQQRQQVQQLPFIYYAYNGSSRSGNYQTPAQDMQAMEPYVLPITNQGGPELPSDRMYKKQQELDKSSRSSKNNSNHDSLDNSHNNRVNINTYNNNYSNNKNTNNNNTNNNNNNNSHSQSQHNKQYVELATSTTNNNVNNADSIVAQPQQATWFDWQDIENKIIVDIRGVDNAKGQNTNGKSNDKERADTERDAAALVGSVENDINSLEDAQFNEVMLPLGNILDKVTQFCGALKRIINEGEGDLAGGQLITPSESDEAFANTASAMAEHTASILETLDTITAADDTAQLSAEVQGQRGVPTIPPAAYSTNTQQSQPTGMVWRSRLTAPRSTAVTASIRDATTNANTTQQTAKSFTSTSLSIGRGKKLKKKLKKLILPLLLAYKLKFMALLPLLVGGLVLLVGSTGMAGFFFALFLTVITLKGGVNKSIVIKKDW